MNIQSIQASEQKRWKRENDNGPTCQGDPPCGDESSLLGVSIANFPRLPITSWEHPCSPRCILCFQVIIIIIIIITTPPCFAYLPRSCLCSLTIHLLSNCIVPCTAHWCPTSNSLAQQSSWCMFNLKTHSTSHLTPGSLPKAHWPRELQRKIALTTTTNCDPIISQPNKTNCFQRFKSLSHCPH